MKLIVVGCEYTGKSTLLNVMGEWGNSVGIRFHLDDHFAIPDAVYFNEEEQKAFMALPPKVKHRYQMFQVHYHVGVADWNEHCIFAGFHIEEAVYGPRYYYGLPVDYLQRVEKELPSDMVLILLTARREVIGKRMDAAPHPHQIIKREDVPELLEEFQQQFSQSAFRQKVQIDTSDLTPEQLRDKVLAGCRPSLNERDMLRLVLRRLEK